MRLAIPTMSTPLSTKLNIGASLFAFGTSMALCYQTSVINSSIERHLERERIARAVSLQIDRQITTMIAERNGGPT